MRLYIKTAIAALALLCAASTASAAVITSTYGDVDGFGQDSGHVGTITDTWLIGQRSWTQTFTLPGKITSAQIELAYAALGFFPPEGVPRLFIDGVLVGPLKDMDGCDGSAAPGVTNCTAGEYTSQLLPLSSLSALNDGLATITIETGIGDAWILDYSRLTLTTAEVPEPASAALLALGLLGAAAARRKPVRRKNA